MFFLTKTNFFQIKYCNNILHDSILILQIFLSSSARKVYVGPEIF